MAPHVDLVVVFRSASGRVQPKALARQNAQAASAQYAKLRAALRTAGLRAVGKRGERAGQLLVLVACPAPLLARLAQRERRADFLSGLPATHPLDAQDLDAEVEKLAPAERLRLVYSYLTSTREDGGLGIGPGAGEWDRVESVMALHDHVFNDAWIRAWTTRQLGLNVQIDKIKEQFGEAVALYFLFLQGYTKFLIFIAAAGVLVYLFGSPYSTLYSIILLVWSVTFVEWWRIKQRVWAVRWGTRGSFRVEKRRAQYQHIAWWQRELRILTSVPVILLFAGVLGVLLTGIFVFEAFVTQLYKGPGAKLLSFAPTVLFVALVPRVLAIYHTYAVRFTRWESHAHQSTHDASLTIKTFALSAIVAYGGLALSAFVYVPFGEEVMTFVQTYLFHRPAVSPLSGSAGREKEKTWAATVLSIPTARSLTGMDGADRARLWETDGANARSKLNPTRLQDQMFAVTVTNQVVNTFLEIGLPYVLRAVASFRAGRSANAKPASEPTTSVKKRVAFEDEPNGGDVAHSANGAEERRFMARVRKEVALPEYTLFEDYSEMVTQFGYVALWSTIWPLAPVMSLLNNWLELRSDAFKIAVHARRPLPARTDTIGPWLDALAFLTWLAALTNSALVYLFRPTDHCRAVGTTLQSHPHHLSTASSLTGSSGSSGSGSAEGSARGLLLSAAVIALAASHGYLVLRAVVRHLLERVLWTGGVEAREAARLETAVKEEYLRSIGVPDLSGGLVAEGMEIREDGQDGQPEGEAHGAFWEHDEGLEELSKGVKDT